MRIVTQKLSASIGRRDQIGLDWMGLGKQSSLGCPKERKKEEENLRKSDCEDNGSKKKRTIVLRQQGESQ